MIVGNRTDFFVQLDCVEKTDDNHWIYGIFNFWIDDLPYPGNGTNITFTSTAWYIIQDYENCLKYDYVASNIPLEQINFEDEDN